MAQQIPFQSNNYRRAFSSLLWLCENAEWIHALLDRWQRKWLQVQAARIDDWGVRTFISVRELAKIEEIQEQIPASMHERRQPAA